MRRVGLVVGGVSALLVLASALIAGLLFYYRPTVEYAFVDIIDKREGPSRPLPGWVLPSIPLGGALVIWLGYRLWRRNAAR